jgi:hypothetical protein
VKRRPRFFIASQEVVTHDARNRLVALLSGSPVGIDQTPRRRLTAAPGTAGTSGIHGELRPFSAEPIVRLCSRMCDYVWSRRFNWMHQEESEEVFVTAVALESTAAAVHEWLKSGLTNDQPTRLR